VAVKNLRNEVVPEGNCLLFEPKASLSSWDVV